MKILGVPLWIIAVGVIIIFLLKRKRTKPITVGAKTIKVDTGQDVYVGA